MKSAQKRKRSGGSQKGHKEREREREVGAKLQTQKLGAKEKKHTTLTLNSQLSTLNSQLTQARFVTQREREVGEKRPKEEEKWGLSKGPQRERERVGAKLQTQKLGAKEKKHTTLTLNSQLSTLNSQLTQARFVTQREREVGEKRPKEEEKWGLSKGPQRERERERVGAKLQTQKLGAKEKKHTTLTLNSQLSTLNSQLTQARFVTQREREVGEKRPKEEEKWGLSKGPQREREREVGAKLQTQKLGAKEKKHTTLTLNSQLSTLNSQLTQARFVTQREREKWVKSAQKRKRSGGSQKGHKERERERVGAKLQTQKLGAKEKKHTTLTLNSQLSTLNSQLSTLNSLKRAL